MSVYFTNNQYLKTAEEDFEAAELLFGHKYYDQVATLCSIAMTKYLKAILEAYFPNSELVPYFSTEDKKKILKRVKEQYPDFEVTEEECDWMDKIYGKAICSDGIHIIMPKQTAVDSLNVVGKLRKIAKAHDKQAVDEKRYSIMHRK